MVHNGHTPDSAFGWFTEDRKQRFCSAITKQHEANLSFALHLSSVHSRMDRREAAQARRTFFVTALRAAFDGVTGVEIREDRGCFLLIFDQQYVIHIKKVKSADSLAAIPKILTQTPDVYQDPLPDLLSDFEEKTPLYELYDLVCAYILDPAGNIVDIYFNDQNDGYLIDQFQLDLAELSSESEPSIAPIPKTKITLKKNTAQKANES